MWSQIDVFKRSLCAAGFWRPLRKSCKADQTAQNRQSLLTVLHLLTTEKTLWKYHLYRLLLPWAPALNTTSAYHQSHNTHSDAGSALVIHYPDFLERETQSWSSVRVNVQCSTMWKAIRSTRDGWYPRGSTGLSNILGDAQTTWLWLGIVMCSCLLLLCAKS